MNDSSRVSPRQALICIANAPSDPEFSRFEREVGVDVVRSLLTAALLDTLAMMIRVDGATLTVVCPSISLADELAIVIPAGIDLIAPDVALRGSERIEFGFRVHLDRGFSRVAAVHADAILPSPRSLATALGVLETADAVLGPASAGGFYLLGVRAERADTTLRYLLPTDRETATLTSARRVLDQLGRAGLVARRLDPHETLSSLSSWTDIPRVSKHAQLVAPTRLKDIVQQTQGLDQRQSP